MKKSEKMISSKNPKKLIKSEKKLIKSKKINKV
jgi:hypothetical protein